MTYKDLHKLAGSIEDDLYEIEKSIPFGKDPDASVIANLHANVAVYIPGLLSRLEGNDQSGARAATKEYFSKYEDAITSLLTKFPDINGRYLDIIKNIRGIYKEILSICSAR